MSDHRNELHEELEQIRVALDQMASEARQLPPKARGPSPRAQNTGAPPTDRSIQVIVEIEARAVTVERLSMVSKQQGWTFGETLEYALDALELAMAKTATGGIPSVYDRVCQQALVSRLEPIFEKVFDPSSFGYRKGRKTADALTKIWREVESGSEWIVDADLKDFLDDASYYTPACAV